MHIHVEMIGGLAGDMFLAASLDAGLITLEGLEQELRRVGLGEEVRVHANKVVRYGIRGTHIHFSGWDPEHDTDHRHLDQIQDMIDASGLAPEVKAHAQSMFLRLGKAEAAIHDIELERVHFHEVGAVDSILDFVGAAYVLASTDATWSFGAIPEGRGMIQTSHGPVPALAPATARLVEGWALAPREIDGELVTPTGAAVLGELPVAARPGQATLKGDGYGAGTKDWKGLANVVRLAMYEEGEASGIERDDVVRLVAEIDDMSPELLAAASEALLEAGALDVVRAPVVMKKGRAGTQLAVLTTPEEEARLARLILEHTTTFGLRVEPTRRYKLARRFETVNTPYGEVRVKIGLLEARTLKATPEYEDCAARAQEHGVSVREVYEHAALSARTTGES